jgi:hypothetical protein
MRPLGGKFKKEGEGATTGRPEVCCRVRYFSKPKTKGGIKNSSTSFRFYMATLARNRSCLNIILFIITSVAAYAVLVESILEV